MELMDPETPRAAAVERPALRGFEKQCERPTELVVEVLGRLFATTGVERLGFEELALGFRMEPKADGPGHAWP